MKKFLAVASAAILSCASLFAFSGCSKGEETVVLRVCSWEEYIDLGEWDEDEVIDLESGDIFGENSMVDDFTEWFNSTHDYNVKVEYSTFGTNEDLYNRLSLGDVYDLVCPSDYMLMKLIDEKDKDGEYKYRMPFSEDFWNTETQENYYAKNVSRYIDGADESIFNSYGWHGLAACYMWGTTGLVYNPDEAETSDVSTWNIFLNEDYKRQVTIKDNVRDAYFATLGIINADKLTGGKLSEEQLSLILNDTDSATIAEAEEVLKNIKDNVYSFETDAGKADMVTGKVVVNYQWSGDAVYIMDEADGDESNALELWYSVPEECANLWFDGWMMMKNGIGESAQKQEAAEAFVNFLSRPDNAVRNMYYIGYTSAIAGDTVFEYMQWNYGADEETENTYEYDLSYFYGGECFLTADADNLGFDGEYINRGRQLFAQYPPQNVIDRSVVMLDFGDKLGEINQMWINVRCLDLTDISPVTVGIAAGVIGAAAIAICLYVFRYKLFIRNKPKDGYEKVEK